jgi:predicted LPLAT superfamily acyltransferase/glycosyltransferase involved in cell wall biosynthesis
VILRVCVVIPTYNNHLTISDVVKDVVLKTKFPVLILDDGSDRPVADYLYSWDVKQAMEWGRVRLKRFEKNQGKGAALQYAIKHLVDEGYTHMLTMDGDGQHLASEIHKLTETAKSHPWDLIIGNRRLRGDTVPESSKFGRKFSNFWVAYQTGAAVRDSQSGFRLYPLFALQTLKFFTRRYDFEIEALIRLMWRGIQVTETEIDVIYQKGSERVSHFNKLWDNVRLSLLNTVLVVLTLLKSRRSPLQLAAATGVGVIIGCTPFFGLHTLIVAGASFLLRLNGLAMLLGSQVSIPPLAPLVILGSIFVGGQWLNIGLVEGPLPHFRQWLLGSLVLGAGLGLIAAIAVYALAWIARHRAKNRSNWNGRARGGRFGNGFLLAVMKLFGLKACYSCLYFIVPYFYLSTPKGRRGLNEYYKFIAPQFSWARRQMAIVRHYFRYGQVLMDRVYQGSSHDLKFETQANGAENIIQEMRSGRGLLLLGGHMGGWDLASSLLKVTGMSQHVMRVEYQPTGYSYHGMTAKLRQGTVTTVDSKSSEEAIFTIHNSLREGKCVALMGDRPIADRFELIPFLGKLAPFDVTAFRLAAATRAPLLFTFGFKGPGNLYEFYGRPSRVYQYNDSLARELQLYAWAEQFVKEVEGFVRRYPEQWFNFYSFWSSVPTAPDGMPMRTTGHSLLEELPIPEDLKPGPAPGPRPSALRPPSASM